MVLEIVTSDLRPITAIGIVLLTLYWIGLLDRSSFEDVIFFQPNRRRLWCVLAMTNDIPNTPQAADKLYEAMKQALLQVHPNQQDHVQQQPSSSTQSKSSTRSSSPTSTTTTLSNKTMSGQVLLSKAASQYAGIPDYDQNSSYVACKVYFEEQGSSSSISTNSGRIKSTGSANEDKFRCGCGYLVGLENLVEAKSLLSTLLQSDPSISNDNNNNKACPYPIRIVDLGKGPARKGRVLWRNQFSPWIARLLHWNSQFSAYCGDDMEIVECELFVPGCSSIIDNRSAKVNQPIFIDYLLLNAKSTTILGPNDIQQATVSANDNASSTATGQPGRKRSTTMRRPSWRKNPKSTTTGRNRAMTG